MNAWVALGRAPCAFSAAAACHVRRVNAQIRATQLGGALCCDATLVSPLSRMGCPSLAPLHMTGPPCGSQSAAREQLTRSCSLAVRSSSSEVPELHEVLADARWATRRPAACRHGGEARDSCSRPSSWPKKGCPSQCNRPWRAPPGITPQQGPELDRVRDLPDAAGRVACRSAHLFPPARSTPSKVAARQGDWLLGTHRPPRCRHPALHSDCEDAPSLAWQRVLPAGQAAVWHLSAHVYKASKSCIFSLRTFSTCWSAVLVQATFSHAPGAGSGRRLQANDPLRAPHAKPGFRQQRRRIRGEAQATAMRPLQRATYAAAAEEHTAAWTLAARARARSHIAWCKYTYKKKKYTSFGVHIGVLQVPHRTRH